MENGEIIPPADDIVGKKADIHQQKLAISDEIACGFRCFRGPRLQSCANQYTFSFFYGILMCVVTAVLSYFSGTITTVEKRFQIPSKISGVLAIGNCIPPIFISVILSYYAGKGRIPRWIAATVYTTLVFCGLMVLPHLLYGPGEDALFWTEEGTNRSTSWINSRENNSLCVGQEHKKQECDETDGNLLPQVIIFLGQIAGGIGTSIYYSMGFVYMDRNDINPTLMGFADFLRMMGSALGYGLAAFSLGFYIDPSLNPTIASTDSRWIGAWWMGWIILAGLVFISASIIALFPKTLPKTVARRALKQLESDPHQQNDSSQPEDDKIVRNIEHNEESMSPRGSFKEMMAMLKSLLRNKALICVNLSLLCSLISVLAYWTFLPKYMEIQYQQSAARSSLFTGAVVLVCNAVGVLLAGFMISKLNLTVKHVIYWNIIIKIISALCMISYVFISCSAKEIGDLTASSSCIENCSCEFATYEPVCFDNVEQFVSPCHAGCRSSQMNEDGTKMYSNCRCLSSPSMNSTGRSLVGTVVSGSCPVDCSNIFYVFLALVCVAQFNFGNSKYMSILVSLQTVREEEKPVAMGAGWMLIIVFAFIPAPILFGYIIDQACVVWSRTCSGGVGNCWVYDTEYLRWVLNLTAAGFAALGALFEVEVVLFMKNTTVYNRGMRSKEGRNVPEPSNQREDSD